MPDRPPDDPSRPSKPTRAASGGDGARGRGRPPGGAWSRGGPNRGGRSSGARKAAPARSAARFDDQPVLFGHHAVAFAWANPARAITRVLATENAERKLREEAAARPSSPAREDVTIERATPRDLDRILGPDTVHQGLLAEVAPLEEPALADLVARAADAGPLILLDQVTDPHNVGAVLRSAAVFGASGVVMTRRHSPPLHGVLGKAASGALDLVPVCLVQNLARALGEIADAGIQRVGLDGDGDVALHDVNMRGPSALVLGAEGKGLRDATRAACSTLAAIATGGPIASLNVSNAAAVSLHHALQCRQRPQE